MIISRSGHSACPRLGQRLGRRHRRRLRLRSSHRNGNPRRLRVTDVADDCRAAPGRALHCDGPAGGAVLRRQRRRARHGPASGGGRETLPMSDSSNSGKFARDAAKSAATGPPRPRSGRRRAPSRPRRKRSTSGRRRESRRASQVPTTARAAAARRRRRRRNRTSAGRFGATAESPDAWAATRAQTALATQLLDDESDYLATDKEDIGRQIGGNERELFVSCAPAEALQQQFEHLQPNFIAVHDIATSRRASS